jgi:hypothetical protein
MPTRHTATAPPPALTHHPTPTSPPSPHPHPPPPPPNPIPHPFPSPSPPNLIMRLTGLGRVSRSKEGENFTEAAKNSVGGAVLGAAAVRVSATPKSGPVRSNTSICAWPRYNSTGGEVRVTTWMVPAGRGGHGREKGRGGGGGSDPYHGSRHRQCLTGSKGIGYMAQGTRYRAQGTAVPPVDGQAPSPCPTPCADMRKNPTAALPHDLHHHCTGKPRTPTPPCLPSAHQRSPKSRPGTPRRWPGSGPNRR